MAGSQRAAARLGVVLALLGALLAAVGLHGSLATAAAERRRELGIRLALGADPRRLSTSVLRSGVRLGLVGAALGLVGAALLGRAMQSLLWGVGAADPLALAGALAVAAAVACASSWIPARRVVRADPRETLRA